MNNITAETTVGEIVRAVLVRSRIFENLGIDYCCGGKKPLAEACQAKGLDPATVVAMLSALDAAPELIGNCFFDAPRFTYGKGRPKARSTPAGVARHRLSSVPAATGRRYDPSRVVTSIGRGFRRLHLLFRFKPVGLGRGRSDVEAGGKDPCKVQRPPRSTRRKSP